MPVVPVNKSFSVPRGHGEALIDPPLDQAESLIRSNRVVRNQYDYDVQGQPLGRLIQNAQKELLREALRHTTAYCDVDRSIGHDQPIILAGHQPQLFHAGVWFKNFALSSIARHLKANAVNLLVDNDILRNPSIRVPAGSSSNRHIATVMFDRSIDAIPYEERAVLDEELFTSFGDRVDGAAAGLVANPLIRQLWPAAIEAFQEHNNAGYAIARARHRLEGHWGQNTLELPVSKVSQTDSFYGFAAHLLAHLPRFQEIHNSSLAEYRRVNRIRSHSHPVPDLAEDGQWLEAPFWVWSSESPHREHLFVRSTGDGLELTDRRQIRVDLELSADADADRAGEQLGSYAAKGIKIRPRALLTTMYSRLVLSDLFLHGIGGAKYDQLTDAIIHRFFGVRPPEFMTISATALLFEDQAQGLRNDLRRTRRLLREHRFHPERHVTQSPEVDRLVEEKNEWIQRQLPKGHRAERHRNIEEVNIALQDRLSVESARLSEELDHLSMELRRELPFASREFSFCLFSEETLRPLLLDLSRAAP